MNKIIIRPLMFAFGWIVFLSGIVLTAAVGYSVMYVLIALWPELGERLKP